MKYNGIVENKLLFIEEQIKRIEAWNITSFATFRENTMLQSAVERSLQLAIEALIDTCKRVLALEKQTPANTAAETVEKMQQLGIISKNPAYLEMVKFRNFLVHLYEKIDMENIYNIVKKHLNDFRTFIDEIRAT
jgi:uncharacterized protein YutE (UPF0331/DUF86 family)